MSNQADLYEHFKIGKHEIMAKKINGCLRDITVRYGDNPIEKFSNGDFSDSVADLIYKLLEEIDRMQTREE